ncbi:hypothetical protein K432DRAFT_403831 [Lepidopterella palustris CBS 459.81]|uniref:Uncharacterized protein n=1 Tax=Lepidopterella palustris CBS 459.81 TaxID=1314670 RepID=A0A8E2ECB2_9PEZI|nr:hypothetical protein K432DRAFT_403831 [Lepidopterella palustris CBS 459.81]
MHFKLIGLLAIAMVASLAMGLPVETDKLTVDDASDNICEGTVHASMEGNIGGVECLKKA